MFSSNTQNTNMEMAGTNEAITQVKKKQFKKAPPPGSLNTGDTSNFAKLVDQSNRHFAILKRFCQCVDSNITIEQRMHLLFTYSRDLIYQEYLNQHEFQNSKNEFGEDMMTLGKRLRVNIDDEDCEFRKRVCI